MSALERILVFLESRSVPCALIGGAALAVHGVARATLDIDLLTDDARVLESAFWTGGPETAAPEIRRGDAADPLAGVIRWVATESPIDLVVGRGRFTSEILARRSTIEVGGVRLPIIGAADLILLKLAAGGPQDLLDVRLLLHGDPGGWRGAVVERLPRAPREAQEAWRRLETDSGG